MSDQIADKENRHRGLYGTLLSHVSAAEILSVEPDVVLDLIRQGKLVGWPGKGDIHIVPRDQIGENGLILQGIAGVLAECDQNHELAWWYLIAPRVFGDRLARPIDLLREDSSWEHRVVINAGVKDEGGL